MLNFRPILSSEPKIRDYEKVINDVIFCFFFNNFCLDHFDKIWVIDLDSPHF